MTPVYLAAIGACAACGAPLFVVFGALAMLLFSTNGIDTQAVIIEMFRMASAPTLVAIPLFTFAGFLLAESKSPQRMVNLYRSLFGWMPGGLAIGAFVVCAFFTSFNGASGVTIIALGGLLYPLLLHEGYSDRFSLGLLTTGGSLGLLFPPSLPLILYALVAQVNVDALFLAGIVPGTFLIVLLSLFSIRAGKRFKVKRQKFDVGQVWPALRDAGWILPLPVLILVGIYGGFFAASEAAAVTVVYVLFVELFIYRDLHWRKDIPRIAAESMILVGGVLIILGCALGFTNYLVDEQVPMKILEFMRHFITSKFMFLIALNVFLLAVGCLMDIFSATIIVVPLIVPIAKEFGVNPIHLGIIFLTNLEIGYIHPPLGMNLFLSSLRFKKSIIELSISVLPFIAVLLFALAVITYVPELSLWLVNVFGRN
ncbi:MAG: TRAP transporter large permease [Pseudomonadota bacterium]